MDETQGLVKRRQRTEEEETATMRLHREQAEQTLNHHDPETREPSPPVSH
ncbi:hypothetical protein [Myxococcus xanthus]|nr:hypothetical protein [Myxococcus xanthus]